MADLTIREVPEAGLAAVDASFFQASAASQTIPANVSTVSAAGWENETVLLLVRNTDAGTPTVTVGAQTAVTMGATTGNAVIPVKRPGRNHAALTVTYSATPAGLTVALVRVGKGY
jgi:hypothetical protein